MYKEKGKTSKNKKFIVQKQDNTNTTTTNTTESNADSSVRYISIPKAKDNKGKKQIGQLNKKLNFDTHDYTDDTDYTDYTTEYDEDSYDPAYDTKEKIPKAKREYTRFQNTNYRFPREGTIQDNMSVDQIKANLKNFIALKTMEDKKILTSLPIFKTWVRYINKNTKQFRMGGFLMKVDYPNYVTLVNTAKNLTWSVQLKDNVFFIREPQFDETDFTTDATTTETTTDTIVPQPKRQTQPKQVYTETEVEEYTEITYTATTSDNSTEEQRRRYEEELREREMIKNRLYELYKRGQLTIRKHGETR